MALALALGILAGPSLTVPAAADTSGLQRALAAAKADMLTNPERAIMRARQALALANAQPRGREREIGRASAQWLMGEAQERLSRPAAALPVLTAAAKTVKRTAPGSVLHGDILLSLGSTLTDLGRVNEALSTLQHAHEVYRETGQARSQAKALIMIALLYNEARDFESALRYFAHASEAYAADDALRMAIAAGRGNALTELGRLPQAEAAFAQSVSLAQRQQSPALEAAALGNMAKVQLLEGKLSEAEQIIARGRAIAQTPDARPIAPELVALAAQAAYQRGNLQRAAALVAQRFEGVDLRTTTLIDRDAHQIAYDVYMRQNLPALALPHLVAMKRLDDQATEIARSTSAALASAKFDYTNQELRIAKLKADDLTKSVRFERAAARTQRNVFIGAALATLAVFVMLAIGLVTLRRSRNQTRAANTDLETTNVALNKALAAKTEFLATTSHEIRTPLNGILGMTQVMAADPGLDAAMRDRIAVVHGAGVTMRALVDDILDVAKIESGKMTIEDAPYDLAATVADAATLWRDQAAEKGLSFTVEVSGSGWIMGDAARLRQIVFNLLSNAVKFTRHGFVGLTCTVVDGRVRIIVADSGIGIDPAVHELIFESFRQADTTTTRQFGGTGLGLSICRNLARAMGGDVTVASRLNEGAVFTLDLPVRAAQDTSTARDVAVVVVERNPIVRATLRAVLEPHGAAAFVDTLLDAEALVGKVGAGTLLVDLASAGGDGAAVTTLAARSGVRTILLLPADAPESVAAPGVLTLRRPLGKKHLVDHVFYPNKALVRDAA